jgi:hypothetical protein
MKRLALPIVILILGFMPQAAAAAERPVTTVETFKDASEPSLVTVCDVDYYSSGTANGVIQSTEFEDGHIEVHVTVTGTLLLEPASGEGPAYSGRYAEAFGFRLNPQNGSFTWVIRIVARASDGSRLLTLDELIHVNQTASGMQVSFEGPWCR